ncbi:MAG: glycosyltransferase [Bacteroidales bacterium]|nr:glycosyltransferase [Bacteroidales bacterium]
MKILFVVNNYYATGNGLSASARRTVLKLKEAGEEVRVLSGPNHEPGGPQPEYLLRDKHYPVVDYLITANGYCFSTRDPKIIREALSWADVVHIEEPFNLQRRTVRMARKMGVPCVGTHHLHPENLLSAIHMGRWRFLNNCILWFWQASVFDWCRDLQCPTKNVSDRLGRSHFKARLHLISNGIIRGEEAPLPAKKSDGKVFTVICVGRLSVEKDQKTLLKAMRYSRYADRIRLVFAGRGPQASNYRKMADRLVRDGVLKIAPEFKFLDKEGLRQLASEADLYIHCATVEVEGLSCLEILREGVVPILADGPLTATAQFALDDRSVFPVRNAKMLADKIDWWLENDAERHAFEKKYAESVDRYDISQSISDIRRMYEAALKG